MIQLFFSYRAPGYLLSPVLENSHIAGHPSLADVIAHVFDAELSEKLLIAFGVEMPLKACARLVE